MCKFNPKNDGRFIDPCMKKQVEKFKNMGFNVVACCCGHNKYNKTIIIKDQLGNVYDSVSKKSVLRKKKFYKKDKQGVYFIPEVEEYLQKRNEL